MQAVEMKDLTMLETVVRSGPAALGVGRLRKQFGQLLLTDESLVFVTDQSGERTVISLADMAWVDVNPRSRRLTLEITLRDARVHYFYVSSVDWVQSLESARKLIDLSRAPIAV
jgi:hypothetical protein